MHHDLEPLKDCIHHDELKSKLIALCNRFGPVARIDVLVANQLGKRQALCFMRLHSEQQEKQLMSELGVGRFGGDIVIVIDMNIAAIEAPVELMPEESQYDFRPHELKPANPQAGVNQ